jgi:hypothetical protein
MSSGSVSDDDCAVRTDMNEAVVHVGSPYGEYNEVPAGLQLLLALIDGAHWPLQVEGDTGVGTGARVEEGATLPCATITALDAGPVPDDTFPDPFKYAYPGVGITAYGCQLNCNYIIVGNLGGSVIVGKIDGQWHILRVIVSASTTPLFGPSNDCRCCGNALKDVKLRARVTYVSSQEGDYRACDVFLIDPLSTELGYNPLHISVSCGSTPESVLEDINDWEVRVLGELVEITSLSCCAEFLEGCERIVYDPSEACVCDGDSLSLSASSSTSSSASSSECRFEITIKFFHLGIEYYVLIYRDIADIDDDPCTNFADVYIEDVIAEAAGLPNLLPDDRVIMARIPGGLAGRTALDGVDPIEWFIIRACNSMDCANPCDEPPVFTSTCCGKPCNELPNILNATIEVIDTDCICTSGSSFGATLFRDGQEDADCSDAANIIWVVAPTTNTTFTEISGCMHNPGGIPPTKVRLANLELKCADSRVDSCGSGSGSGSGSDDISELGPNMILTVFGFGGYGTTVVSSIYNATQDRHVSCCSPFYVQFEVTGAFCFGAGASPVGSTTTLRITITG